MFVVAARLLCAARGAAVIRESKGGTDAAPPQYPRRRYRGACNAWLVLCPRRVGHNTPRSGPLLPRGMLPPIFYHII